jgi:hypothetical protein
MLITEPMTETKTPTIKLLDFTLRDAFNAPIETILEEVKDSLNESCIMNFWEHDFTYFQSKPVEINEAGEKAYTFEVHGTYLKGERKTGQDFADEEAREEAKQEAERKIARAPEL